MNITHEYVKVVNVQFPVELNTAITDLTLNDLVSNKVIIQEKVETVFSNLAGESPQFVVFPEYSHFPELESTLIAKSAELNTIIITGSYINSDLIPEVKIIQPNGQISKIQKSGLASVEYFIFPNITLKDGELPSIFSYQFAGKREINFLVLICYDFYDQYYKFFGQNLDFLFITAYNKNFEKFYSQLEEFCCKNPSFCVYSNAADVSCGNSAIFGIHEQDLHSRNVINGTICDGKQNYGNLIVNLPPQTSQMIIAEVDINRPWVIKPHSVAGNNIPNVINIRKMDI